MKRAVAVIFFVSAISLTGFSQTDQTLPWFGTHYQPGNTSFALEGGLDFGAALSLAAAPSAEVILTKFRPFNLFSIDLGLAIRGLAALRFADAGATTTVGAGPLLMFHGGLRGMSGSFGTVLDQVDFYTGFGLGYVLSLGPDSSGGLAWVNANGLNFFLSEAVALRLGTSYFSPFDGGTGSFSTNLGVMLKIGPAEEVGEGMAFLLPDPDAISGEAMYFTFSSLYALAAFSGGYLPSDETFEPGDGVVIEQRYVDDGEVQMITLFRALLHDGGESQWWRFEFDVDDESFAFEAEIDGDGEILLIRYQERTTGEVMLHEPVDPSRFEAFREREMVRSEEEMAALVVGQGRVTVEAGTFTTDRLESAEEGYVFTWWLSNDVPGRMVQFEGEQEEGERFSGELIEIVRGYDSPWGPAW